MIRTLLPALLILLTQCTGSKNKELTHFSLHLFQEPMHLDPTRARASTSSYFFYNILRGLYKINERNELETEGGECQWLSSKKLTCEIKDQLWWDGTPVQAKDYQRSFIDLIDPENASPRAHLLGRIDGAQEIMSGQKNPNEIAFEITSAESFSLHFKDHDPEFLYKLASTALFPTHKNRVDTREDYQNFIGNGPYKIETWQAGKHLELIPNPHYKKGHPNRPPVKIYFIDDEMTAYRLYEKGELQFLRRIPSKLFHKVLERDDFFQLPMLRFDYVGFGNDLKDNKNLRAALSHSVNYEVLKKLLFALERPGCPSIPKVWMDEQPCYAFDLKAAKKWLSKVSEEDKNKVYDLKVSQQGGNDIKKQAEFLQNQWKKHLGLNVRVSQVEGKVLINELRTSPPDIFRKGVGLDRPTCLSALETFSADSKQNYLEIKDSEYGGFVTGLKEAKSPQQYKKICQKANEYLLKNYFLIPLGEMHFGIMAKKSFSGWKMNGMNQLDLSQLSKESSQK
jgi:oligopeptide transport system substrate-binding protein